MQKGLGPREKPGELDSENTYMGKRRQGRFEMSCKIGNGMVLASEMFVSLESASMGEGAWHLFSLLNFLPKSQVWGVELCTGLGRCHGTASYSRFFKTF